MTDDIKLTIWGREFILPIEHACPKDEIKTKEQLSALKSFESHPEWLDKAKHKAEAYCKEQVQADQYNEKKDNIFSYLKPHYIYVKQAKNKVQVALMCKYRYDLEHGIAIVFSLDGSVDVNSQDYIL